MVQRGQSGYLTGNLDPCAAGAVYIQFRVGFRRNKMALISIKWFVIGVQLIKMLIFTHVYFS